MQLSMKSTNTYLIFLVINRCTQFRFLDPPESKPRRQRMDDQPSPDALSVGVRFGPSQAAPSAPLPLLNSTQTIPTLIYGTAWKKERTADLVYQAIKAGFRAIDTAAQPKHYQEDLVGDGVRRAIAEGIVRREDLFVSRPFLLVHMVQVALWCP